MLNPINEDDMYDNGTEEEIKQAVFEQCAADQGREENAGDGDDLDEVGEVKPSCWEALAAALSISRYVANIDEPFACKLEVILMGFGHQTHTDALNSLKPTNITDFFTFRNT